MEMTNIQKAFQYLAGICDGACQIDGQGFNKFDSRFGKSLAEQANWSDKQLEIALKIGVKYQGQLKRAGFDTATLFDQNKQKEIISKNKKEEKKDKTVTIENGLWVIRFRYEEDLKNKIKEGVPGRRFDPNNKVWTCPPSQEAATILTELGFSFPDGAEENLPKATPATPEKKEVNVEEIEDALQKRMRKNLYPYQKEGVIFLEKKDGRGLIGDEMGLGKTLQALSWLAIHPEKRPAIILVPAHLKLNWEREIHTSFRALQKLQVLNGKTPQAITGEIIIINYDILSYWLETLLQIQPKALVMDEAHYIKNSKTQRTKATKELAKRIPHVIALTGTPIVNRPSEAFNTLQILDKKQFSSYWKYAQRYCGAHHNGFGWDFTGASNKEELYSLLVNTVMIRRKKKEVLPELPDKQFSFVPIEINNRKEYKKAAADFIHYVRMTKGNKEAIKASRAEHLVRIEALKQLAVKGKIDQAIEWVQNFLDSNNGEKLVLFATHKEIIDALMNKFHKEAVKVDGSVTAVQKDQAEQEFQNNPDIRLFIGNIKAAGTGLTLTAASSVAFLELPWTPGDLVQAEDRVHRIGQKDSVNVYYLLAHNTIEQSISALLDEKREVLDMVLDGKVDKDRPDLMMSLEEIVEKLVKEED